MLDNIIGTINSGCTISVNRHLAHRLGLNAALLFNAIIVKQHYYEQHNMLDSDGFFYSTIEDMKESTALSRCQQDRAVSVLVKAGLIDFRRGGACCRRHFRVREEAAGILEDMCGAVKKSSGSLQEISKAPCEKPTNHPVNNLQSALQENDKPIYINHNKKNNNNKNLSINHIGENNNDGKDRMDNTSRNEYLGIIRKNIDYDYLPQKERKTTDQLIELMLDVICSNKSTIRVNGEELSHEAVKKRFLQLGYEHIDYVLLALKRNTSNVKNIRSYLITALYNSPATIDNYYTAIANYDLSK